MDVHIPRPITRELRQRGVDVLTAQEDGADELDDSLLMDQAATLGRVIFSYDDDFLKEAARRQANGQPFSGVITLQREHINFRVCLDDLEVVAKVYDAEDIRNCVEYLPL